jgi:hypothetical protein
MKPEGELQRDLSGHVAEYEQGRADYAKRKRVDPMGGNNPHKKGSLAAEAFNEGWFDAWADDPLFGKGKT